MNLVDVTGFGDTTRQYINLKEATQNVEPAYVGIYVTNPPSSPTVLTIIRDSNGDQAHAIAIDGYTGNTISIPTIHGNCHLEPPGIGYLIQRTPRPMQNMAAGHEDVRDYIGHEWHCEFCGAGYVAYRSAPDDGWVIEHEGINAFFTDYEVRVGNVHPLVRMQELSDSCAMADAGYPDTLPELLSELKALKG